MKIKFKKYLLYMILSMCFWLTFAYIYYEIIYKNNTDIINKSVQRPGINYSIDILIHNTQNYLMFILGFIISPILVIFNNILIINSITSYVSIFGFSKSIPLLFPHGYLEIPMLLTCEFLSLNMFLNFWKYKSVYKIIKYVICNKYYFIITYISLVVAAFVEGVIG